MDLRGGVLSYSCVMQDSSGSSFLALCYQTFHVMMHQMFSVGERCGLQTCQFSNQTLVLQSCNGCSMRFCIVLLKCARLSLKEMSGWEHMLR